MSLQAFLRFFRSVHEEAQHSERQQLHDSMHARPDVSYSNPLKAQTLNTAPPLHLLQSLERINMHANNGEPF